jgi:hypothetical protein
MCCDRNCRQASAVEKCVIQVRKKFGHFEKIPGYLEKGTALLHSLDLFLENQKCQNSNIGNLRSSQSLTQYSLGIDISACDEGPINTYVEA